jgi:hypothetical protein
VSENSNLIVSRTLKRESFTPIKIPPELPTDDLKNQEKIEELKKVRVLEGKESTLVS